MQAFLRSLAMLCWNGVDGTRSKNEPLSLRPASVSPATPLHLTTYELRSKVSCVPQIPLNSQLKRVCVLAAQTVRRCLLGELELFCSAFC